MPGTYPGLASEAGMLMDWSYKHATFSTARKVRGHAPGKIWNSLKSDRNTEEAVVWGSLDTSLFDAAGHTIVIGCSRTGTSYCYVL